MEQRQAALEEAQGLAQSPLRTGRGGAGVQEGGRWGGAGLRRGLQAEANPQGQGSQGRGRLGEAGHPGGAGLACTHQDEKVIGFGHATARGSATVLNTPAPSKSQGKSCEKWLSSCGLHPPYLCNAVAQPACQQQEASTSAVIG